MTDRLWMFQLNPKNDFVRGVRTTAANLYARLDAEERRWWSVNKNHLRAEVGDPVIIKVARGRRGEPDGLVAFGRIAQLRGDQVQLAFDRDTTAALMERPVPLEDARKVLGVDRSNLVDLAPHAQWVRAQLRERLVPQAIVPFEADRVRREVAEFITGDEVATWASSRKTGDVFARRLHRLADHLEQTGWRDLEEGVCSFDLRATRAGQVTVFAVEDEDDWALGVHITTSLLLAWRSDCGPQTRLTFVTERELPAPLAGLLETAGIDLLDLRKLEAKPPRLAPRTRRGLGPSRSSLVGRPHAPPAGVALKRPLRGASARGSHSTAGTGPGNVCVALDLRAEQRRASWTLPAGLVLRSLDPEVQHGLLIRTRSTNTVGSAAGRRRSCRRWSERAERPGRAEFEAGSTAA
jgi:hypothetical protein